MMVRRVFSIISPGNDKKELWFLNVSSSLSGWEALTLYSLLPPRKRENEKKEDCHIMQKLLRRIACPFFYPVIVE